MTGKKFFFFALAKARVLPTGPVLCGLFEGCTQIGREIGSVIITLFIILTTGTCTLTYANLYLYITQSWRGHRGHRSRRPAVRGESSPRVATGWCVWVRVGAGPSLDRADRRS